MDPLLNEVIAELKRKHGNKLDLENHHYFLFFDDGVFDIYLDQDEKELKVDIVFSDGIQVYHSSKKLEELIKE